MGIPGFDWFSLLKRYSDAPKPPTKIIVCSSISEIYQELCGITHLCRKALSFNCEHLLIDQHLDMVDNWLKDTFYVVAVID